MRINLQLFGGRGTSSSKIYLHRGKQGKHWEWHNNFMKGKSIVTLTPEQIEKLVKKYKGDTHNQREEIDFGVLIGKWYNSHDKQFYETTRGKIHWGKDGGYHVVPAPPNNWEFE